MSIPNKQQIEAIHQYEFIPVDTIPYPKGKDFFGVEINEQGELIQFNHCCVDNPEEAGVEWITHWFPSPLSG